MAFTLFSSPRFFFLGILVSGEEPDFDMSPQESALGSFSSWRLFFSFSRLSLVFFFIYFTSSSPLYLTWNSRPTRYNLLKCSSINRAYFNKNWLRVHEMCRNIFSSFFFFFLLSFLFIWETFSPSFLQIFFMGEMISKECRMPLLTCCIPGKPLSFINVTSFFLCGWTFRKCSDWILF